MDKVITVSREFGSGGRELGVKLAEKLDIPFYDKELISMAADDINIAEEAFQNYDEHIVIHDPLDRQYYHAFLTFTKYPCRTRFSWPSPMSSAGWLLTVHVSLWDGVQI